MSLQGNKVVVTGGRGFLGGFVCKALKAKGADVVPIGSSEYNLICQQDVGRMYQELQPDIVVHLAAACGGIGANVENPARFLYENAIMGLMLLEEGRQNDLKKFVLISTTCSYPKDAPLPCKKIVFGPVSQLALLAPMAWQSVCCTKRVKRMVVNMICRVWCLSLQTCMDQKIILKKKKAT